MSFFKEIGKFFKNMFMGGDLPDIPEAKIPAATPSAPRTDTGALIELGADDELAPGGGNEQSSTLGRLSLGKSMW